VVHTLLCLSRLPAYDAKWLAPILPASGYTDLGPVYLGCHTPGLLPDENDKYWLVKSCAVNIMGKQRATNRSFFQFHDDPDRS